MSDLPNAEDRKQEEGPPVFDLRPKTAIVSIDGKNYPVSAMEQSEAEEWMSLRVSTHWRQLVLFRQLSSKVNSAFSLDKDDRNKLDEDIHSLTRQWITLNNILVSKSLGFDTSNLTKEQIDLVHSLDENSKIKILAIQDRLNGLDLINVLADIDSKLSKARKEIVEKEKEEIKAIQQEERSRSLNKRVEEYIKAKKKTKKNKKIK